MRHVLLGVLICAAFACSRPTTALEPVKRLEDELVPAGGGPFYCEIGGEFRPSIGCVWPKPLRSQKTTVGQDGRVRLELTIPSTDSPRLRLIEVRLRKPRRIENSESSVFLVPGTQSKLPIDRPVSIERPGKEVLLGGFVYELPPPTHRLDTRTMLIPEGAVLEVGLGIAPIAVRAGASPVEFRLLAVDEAGTLHPLLQRTLTPEESTAWVDERIDLAGLAGRRMHFVFETSVRPGVDGDPANAFTVGLWGGAKLLALRRPESRYDLVLISLDTLRADVVGTAVDGDPVTPEMDAIAADGTRFTDVMTTYPSTSAAHMSMFTGIFPAVHGVTFPTNTLPETISTLPQLLAARGFMTAAVTEGGMLAARSGFRRGFDSYREFSGETAWSFPRQAERTFAAGVDWVKRHRNQRFFLFLHTYQVHGPYTPPPEFLTGQDETRSTSLSAGRALYEAEVRYTDSAVGKLIKDLDREGALDHAIVVITSDHGEEFLEHHGIGHALTVYEEVMRVPLILWGPGVVPEGRVLSEPASLVDIVPTLLELAGLPAEPGLQGKSLVPAMHGEAFDAERVRFAEGPARKSDKGGFLVARERQHKWIARSRRAVEAEMYDLHSDPSENRPIDAPELRARGLELFARFEALVNRGKQHERPAERKLDEETESKLRRLGYVE